MPACLLRCPSSLPVPCARSLGDLTAATVGCTSDPEVSFTTLRPGVDHVLVMASDGVWDVLTNEQVCDIVVESPDPHIACRCVGLHSGGGGSSMTQAVAGRATPRVDTAKIAGA